MGKILITGATGGLGSAVANFLSKKVDKSKIAVLVRDKAADQAKALASQGFELRVADYNDKEALVKAFTDIAQLYFVSGSDIANRMPQHRNVVEAATKAKVGHIIYTSVSIHHLAEEAPLYGAMLAHFETEKLIKQSGLNFTLLRHNLYSEVIAMFLGGKEQLLGSKTVFLPTGNGKTAFVARIELAEAAANILAKPELHVNKTYEFNGSEKVSFAEVATYLSGITKENIAYVSPQPKEFEETLKKFGVPDQYIGMMLVFGLAIADGSFDTTQNDLETILGRRTQRVEDFLKQVYS
jgi:NAD(P)H dehydrogenase (quinone)